MFALGSFAHISQNASHKDDTTKSEATPSNNDAMDAKAKQHVGMIKTDFTDKLAAKPYLNYHNHTRHGIVTSAINSGKKLWGRFARDDANAVVTSDNWAEDAVSGYPGGKKGERPKGVPRRIRILAIDVPEFREVFDGECRVNLSRVYPDDVAPAKYIPRKVLVDSNATHDSKNPKDLEQIEIVQKSLARSLVRCRNAQSKRIGVELLEASVYDLNPNNMRRTYHIGKYKYDPGKYGSTRDGTGGDMLQRRMSVSPSGSKLNLIRKRGGKTVVTKSEVTDESASLETQNNNDEKGVADVDESVQDGDVQEESDGKTEMTVLAEEEDEVDAPWHQSAWIEEMQLRVSTHPFYSIPE